MEMFNVVIPGWELSWRLWWFIDKLNPFKPGNSSSNSADMAALGRRRCAALPASSASSLTIGWSPFHNLVSVAIMLIIYERAAFIYLEKRGRWSRLLQAKADFLIQTALYIGLSSLVPLSPADQVRYIGLLNGVSRPVVTEFTFYLGIQSCLVQVGWKSRNLSSNCPLEFRPIIPFIGSDGWPSIMWFASWQTMSRITTLQSLVISDSTFGFACWFLVWLRSLLAIKAWEIFPAFSWWPAILRNKSLNF